MNNEQIFVPHKNQSAEKLADARKTQILIVTGYSGAGKSSVLRVLEDIGFFCIDNLPIPLLGSLFQLLSQSTMNCSKVALGIDVRGLMNMQDLISELQKLNMQQEYTIKIFFIRSSVSVLLKRFQETRRKHPLADAMSLADAIAYEKDLLKPLIERSDMVLDTDQLNIHQLRHFVRETFSGTEKPELLVNLISFGFKYGVPHESNYVYDVRSLPNPYFISELKPLDGTSQEIRSYLFDQPEVREYWQKFVDFFTYSVTKSYEEGRFFITIAIGCTGGRHRSVAFVHQLSQMPLAQVKYIIKHRDLMQESNK